MHSAEPFEFEDIHLLGGIDFVVSSGGAGTVVVVAAQAIPQAVLPWHLRQIGADKHQNNLDLDKWNVVPYSLNQIWMNDGRVSLTELVRRLRPEHLRHYKNNAEKLSKEIMQEENNFVERAIRWAREIRSERTNEYGKII
jgi:hypothetical protein